MDVHNVLSLVLASITTFGLGMTNSIAQRIEIRQVMDQNHRADLERVDQEFTNFVVTAHSRARFETALQTYSRHGGTNKEQIVKAAITRLYESKISLPMTNEEIIQEIERAAK